jgi:molybdopterin molybdotransferase
MTVAYVAKITVDTAHEILRSQIDPLVTEPLTIRDGALRVLAEPIKARIDSPRADVTAMDGFVEDATAQAGRREFSLVGTSYAGDASGHENSPETTVRIMTGAPIPQSKDRVIPFELVEEREGGCHVV